jgi:hypothetical protein
MRTEGAQEAKDLARTHIEAGSERRETREMPKARIEAAAQIHSAHPLPSSQKRHVCVPASKTESTAGKVEESPPRPQTAEPGRSGQEQRRVGSREKGKEREEEAGEEKKKPPKEGAGG